MPNIKKIRVPVTDKLDPNRDLVLLKNNMDKILDFIDEKIDENNIFVYCYNGLTVSPLIVALYMTKKGNISKDDIRLYYLNLKTIIFAWILIYLCSNHIWNLPLLSIGLSTRFSIVPNHHSSPPFEKICFTKPLQPSFICLEITLA